MDETDRIREGLATAIGGVRRGSAVADRLCVAAVDLLDVDGVALVLTVGENTVSRSLGRSSTLSGQLTELQFMLGEGPCMETDPPSAPVMVADLTTAAGTSRWPLFAGAATELGVRAVFALPVAVAGFPAGTLLLHRTSPGPLLGAALTGAFFAAELAALPILDVMGLDLNAAVGDHTSHAWAELATLTRSEVYQAAGVLIVQLGVTPAAALVRIRAHAFAHGRTTSETAYDILEHRVYLTGDTIDDEQHEG